MELRRELTKIHRAIACCLEWISFFAECCKDDYENQCQYDEPSHEASYCATLPTGLAIVKVLEEVPDFSLR